MFKSFLKPHYQFEEEEILLSFRVKMLHFLVFAVTFFAFLFGFLDLFKVHVQGDTMRNADFFVALLMGILFIYLKRSKQSYKIGLYILVIVTFTIFTLAFFLVPQDTFRQVWFLALIMAVFMLHTTTLALIVSGLSIALIAVSYFYVDINMNELSFVTTMISLIVITFILYFYTRRVNHYEESLMQKNQELDRLASHDNLTGVMNRRIFLNMSNKYFLKSKRKQEPLYFLMVDIDYFKTINDTYGHQAGDYVLIHTADRISNSLRENDLFGRLGGEEFGVAIIENDLDDALSVSEKIRKAVESKSFIFNGKEIIASVSIGIGSSEGCTTLTDTMHKADMAMYLAKHSGRNCVKTEKELGL